MAIEKRQVILMSAAAGMAIVAVYSIRKRKAQAQSQDVHEYGTVSYPTSSAPVIVLPDILKGVSPQTITSLFNSPNQGLQPYNYSMSHQDYLLGLLPGTQQAVKSDGTSTYDATVSMSNLAASGLGNPHIVTTASGDRLVNPATGTYSEVN